MTTLTSLFFIFLYLSDQTLPPLERKLKTAFLCEKMQNHTYGQIIETEKRKILISDSVIKAIELLIDDELKKAAYERLSK